MLDQIKWINLIQLSISWDFQLNLATLRLKRVFSF